MRYLRNDGGRKRGGGVEYITLLKKLNCAATSVFDGWATWGIRNCVDGCT